MQGSICTELTAGSGHYYRWTKISEGDKQWSQDEKDEDFSSVTRSVHIWEVWRFYFKYIKPTLNSKSFIIGTAEEVRRI